MRRRGEESGANWGGVEGGRGGGGGDVRLAGTAAAVTIMKRCAHTKYVQVLVHISVQQHAQILIQKDLPGGGGDEGGGRGEEGGCGGGGGGHAGTAAAVSMIVVASLYG